jgi:hypothetical protein
MEIIKKHYIESQKKQLKVIDIKDVIMEAGVDVEVWFYTILNDETKKYDIYIATNSPQLMKNPNEINQKIPNHAYLKLWNIIIDIVR